MRSAENFPFRGKFSEVYIQLYWHVLGNYNLMTTNLHSRCLTTHRSATVISVFGFNATLNRKHLGVEITTVRLKVKGLSGPIWFKKYESIRKNACSTIKLGFQ